MKKVVEFFKSLSIDWIFIAVVLGMGYFIVWDILLEIIARKAGLASGGVSLGVDVLFGIMFFPLLTRCLAIAYKSRLKREKLTWKELILSMAKIGVIIYVACYPLDMAIRDLRSDLSRIVNAAQRPVDNRFKEALKIRFLPDWQKSDRQELSLKKGTFPAGTLKGQRIAGPYVYRSAKIGDSITVDMNQVINSLYTKKLLEDPVIKEFYKTRVKRYCAKKVVAQGSLDYIRGEIAEAKDVVARHIDWSWVRNHGGIKRDELACVQEVFNQFTVDDCLTCGFTELFGELNKTKIHLADLMARVGGNDVFDLIPSKDPSFGWYQFTAKATAVVKYNHALSKAYRLPTSFLAYQGMDHHKAFFLSLIANSVELVKRIGVKRMRTEKSTVKLCLLTAHNKPIIAFDAMAALQADGFINAINDTATAVKAYASRILHNEKVIKSYKS